VLSLPGVNDIVDLSFFPLVVSDCPDSGRDADCEGDKYQACVLDTQCNGVSCSTSQQLQLAQFLHCFEAENDVDMDAADGCASAAGFDAAAVRGCFNDEGALEEAYGAVLRAAGRELDAMQCFPWVTLDGEVLSTQVAAACLGEDASVYPLLDDICRAAGDKGLPMPAACNSDAAM